MYALRRTAAVTAWGSGSVDEPSVVDAFEYGGFGPIAQRGKKHVGRDGSAALPIGTKVFHPSIGADVESGLLLGVAHGFEALRVEG